MLRVLVRRHFREHPRSRGDVRWWAEVARVTERTIRNWIHREPGRPGRPGRPAAERRRGFRAVARVCVDADWTLGWRKVCKALGGAVPVGLVQQSLSAAKRLHDLHEVRRMARRRVHVEVLGANVLWHQDSTHLGRVGRSPSQAEILRDALRPDVLGASAGGVVRGRDAVALLESAIAAEALAGNEPPLVVSTDNGPPYRSRPFKECLTRHRIVHLRNLPRTPQHNARAERTIRDVKQASGLGRGVLLDSFEEAQSRVALACERLAALARIRGGVEPLTVPYTQDQRDRFYAAVCRRIAGAVQCARNARERRMAEREAIFAELEERGLIRRTRGGATRTGPKEERVS